MAEDAVDERLRLPLLSSLAAPLTGSLDVPSTASTGAALPPISTFGSMHGNAGLPGMGSPLLPQNDPYGNKFASMNALASTSQQAYDIPTSPRYAQPTQQQAAAVPSSSGLGTKRKDSGGIGSGSEAGAQDGSETGKAKKPKIPRACDICRRKKIRCNPIPDMEPMLCTYCQKHKLDCTWFLPIAETRFKKQREKQEAEKAKEAAEAAAASLPTASSSVTLARQHNSASYDRDHSSPQPASAGAVPKQQIFPIDANRSTSSPDPSHHLSGPRKEPRIVGYTSISHLMHSTSTFPTERMIPVDFKYSQQLSVDERGDGFIRVISAGDGDPAQGGEPVAIQGIEHSDAEKLLNYFFTTHANHFPIVAKADFLGSERPTPLLFNSICAVSALSHHVAPSILRTIKTTIRSHLRDEDMLDNSTIPNIQALLIYAFSMELEKGTAASKTWNILGLAVRMAQDLGLHRKLGSEKKEQSEADHTELRRRVWGGCLIADRWIAAIYGQPMMIDLADCDTMLPSVFDIRPNLQFDSERRPYLFNSALISLSVLLGRILKGVYSPTGIMLLTEKHAKSLVSDLNAWHDGLPEELKFRGPEKSTPEQGFLHLLYIPVRFLITRPFMRISFQLPERFASLSVGTQHWSVVEAEAREAIEWVDKNESCLEGWFVGTYAFFICSLIQYHSHIRRRDAASLTTLRLARDCLKRLVVPDGECYVRAKIAEIIHLLYHTACSVARWAPEAAEGMSPASSGTTAVTTLNPTAGVRQREQDWHLRYRKDGGYFVTDRRINDPSGLIRSSASPSSNGPSPRGHPSPYSSSLRSTHLAGEPSADPAVTEPATGALPAVTTTEPVSVDAVSTTPTASVTVSNGSERPTTLAAATSTSTSDPALATAATSVPDMSFALQDSVLDGMSFNPTLNLGNPAASFLDPTGNPGGQSLPSFFGGVGEGAAAFDPFGFSGDGTPSMLPDSLFDWQSWRSFADSLGLPAQALPQPAPEPPNPESFFQ
ncbi:hypothetical protein JCM10908_005505 [Rhodotorula pacifica]|uniref:uncharacterized protein n=1 Tax=Rhodotorula pacifica TaxID=1495444 RepID=UPI0031770B9F